MTDARRRSRSGLRACPACGPRPTSGWSPTCSAAATGTPARATTARSLPAGEGQVVVGGEAMLPAFVAADPYGAGVAAVLTNVNDLAAMGAAPVALVDTVVGAARSSPRGAARACAGPAGCYDVPDRRRAPDAHRRAAGAVGVRRRPGASACCRRRTPPPGRRWCSAAASTGAMRPDFPFFPSFDERGDRLAGDVRLLAELAASRACVAAKDVSMAGLVGSLAMLLEPTGSA